MNANYTRPQNLKAFIFCLAFILTALKCPLCNSQSPCDPQGRPTWSDTRYRENPQSVIDDAMGEIQRLIPAVKDIIKEFKHPPLYSPGNCEEGADACSERIKFEEKMTDYKKETRCMPIGFYDQNGCWIQKYVWDDWCYCWQEDWEPVTDWYPHTTVTYRFETTITMTNCLFTRGWLNMDPKLVYLPNATYNYSSPNSNENLYYCYATSLQEAVMFVLLHELKHLSGTSSEDEANRYASQMIVEKRKKDRGLVAYFQSPGRPSQVSASSENRNSYKSRGVPPPLFNLPPGSIMK